MRRLIRAFATALTAAAVAFPVLPAPAAESALSVSPAVAERGTLPGRTVEERVQITNLSSGEDFNISTTVTPLEVDDAGNFSSAGGESSLSSAAGWGKVEPAAFLLSRGHSQEVKISFTPPNGTPAQGYFAAVRFTGASPDGARISVVHAVLLEVGGAELVRSAKVAGVSAPSRSFGNTIPVTVRLENTGNVAVMASGVVKLRDVAGNVTAEESVARTAVIPGHVRVLKIDMPAPFLPGSAKVTADFGFGEGVPRDSATASVLSITYWQAGAAVVLLLLLFFAIRALVRWRRRRKAAKRRAPATVAAPPVTSPPVAARTDGAVVAPAAARPAPILADSEMQTFWDDDEKAVEYKPVPEMPVVDVEAEAEAEVEPEGVEEPASSPFARPAAEPEPEPEPAPIVLAPAPFPAPMTAPEAEAEREPEPEPMPAASLTVVPPVAAEPEPVHVEEPTGARVSALATLVKAGMPDGPAAGPQASLRRALVALELMTEKGARSAERIDVGLGLLRWTRGDEVVSAVESAFDDAVASGKKLAIAALALAMAEVGSSRSTEALLRAYASAPRHLASRLRDALHRAPVDDLRDRGELLDALPADRRSALKVG